MISFAKLSAINIREIVAACFKVCTTCFLLDALKIERQNSSDFSYHYLYMVLAINPMLIGTNSKQGIWFYKSLHVISEKGVIWESDMNIGQGSKWILSLQSNNTIQYKKSSLIQWKIFRIFTLDVMYTFMLSKKESHNGF